MLYNIYIGDRDPIAEETGELRLIIAMNMQA